MTKSLETKIHDAVHSIEPSPEFSEKLLNQIMDTPRQEPVSRGILSWVWIPASAVLTLALILAIASPQNVMASFRNLLAYLPGIGFVQEDESTLYLSEPVTVEQDGVSLTIEQVVADANKTVISYRIDGLPTDGSCFYDENRLLLPDGTSRPPIGGSAGDNLAHLEFLPLPDGVTQDALIVSMSSVDPSCSAPQEMRVDFSLGTTMPTDIEMSPVIENPPPEISSADPVESNPVESVHADVQLIIDKVAVLEDGYLLLGHTEWANEHWQNVRVDMQRVSALDAEGNDVPLVQTDEGSSNNEFAFRISGSDFAAPITFQVENLSVWAYYEDGTAFTFDAGADPQIGQSWELNQELEIEGHKIIVQSVSAVERASGLDENTLNNGYAVIVDNVKDMNGAIFCKGQGEVSMSWGQTMPVDESSKVFETIYPDDLPYGQVTCSFRDFNFQLPGSWQIEWQPPAAVE